MSRSARFRQAYPDELSEREASFRLPRPKWVAGGSEPKKVIGLALSGGGVRSATFGLGILQALASKRLIGEIDYVSTVSGGGYIGAFLTRLFSRDGATVESIEEKLSPGGAF